MFRRDIVGPTGVFTAAITAIHITAIRTTHIITVIMATAIKGTTPITDTTGMDITRITADTATAVIEMVLTPTEAIEMAATARAAHTHMAAATVTPVLIAVAAGVATSPVARASAAVPGRR